MFDLFAWVAMGSTIGAAAGYAIGWNGVCEGCDAPKKDNKSLQDKTFATFKEELAKEYIRTCEDNGIVAYDDRVLVLEVFKSDHPIFKKYEHLKRKVGKIVYSDGRNSFKYENDGDFKQVYLQSSLIQYDEDDRSISMRS